MNKKQGIVLIVSFIIIIVLFVFTQSSINPYKVELSKLNNIGDNLDLKQKEVFDLAVQMGNMVPIAKKVDNPYYPAYLEFQKYQTKAGLEKTINKIVNESLVLGLGVIFISAIVILKLKDKNEEKNYNTNIDNQLKEPTDLKIKLDKLKQLYQDDVITEEEYNKKRDEIISKFEL